MQLEEISKKLNGIKKELSRFGHDITVGRLFVYDVDDIRIAYLNTEIDTLLFILESLKMKRYKESFVMLRSTFEEFLYFWLMLRGKKYKWTIHYHIEKQSSNTNTKDTRDKTYDKWLGEKESGNEAFRDAINIAKGKKEDEIIVNYIHEGVYGEGTEVVPMYHFILKELDPEMVHLSRVKHTTDIFLKVNHSYTEIIQTQKAIYHRFFYIDSMIENLLLNNLVTDFTKNQILVHYNFLSKFIHPTKESVKMYQHLSGEVQVYGGYKDDILEDLIILYIFKLMHQYIKNFVYAYRLNQDVLTSSKYDVIINELDQMSKDLWFLDNSPTPEDIRWSDEINHGYYRGIKVKDPDTKLHYYTDPFERMFRLRRTL